MNAEELKKVPGIRWDASGHIYAESPEAEKALVKYWLSECPLGQEFSEHYNGNPANMSAMIEQSNLHAEYKISLRNLDWVFTQLKNAGKITTAEAEAAARAAIPRDKNGARMTEAQQRWSEYRTFSESHTMDECRARAQREPDGYGVFMRKNYEREGLTQGQGTILNAPRETPKSNTSADLVAWVGEYLKTPMDKVRGLRSPAMNPLGYQRYNEMLEAAIAAKLI